MSERSNNVFTDPVISYWVSFRSKHSDVVKDPVSSRVGLVASKESGAVVAPVDVDVAHG